MTELTLYQYWRSSCSWRVRWALNFKGLPYKTESVNLLKSEQKSAKHAHRNASLNVPSLNIDGEWLNESIAIIEWLEEFQPEPSLLPPDPMEKAKVRELSLIIATGIQPLQNLSVLNHYAKDKDDKIEIGKHWIERGIRIFEQSVAKHAGDFSFGNDLSMADLCLIPQVYNAKRFGVDMSDFPIVSRINDACLLREDCRSAHPDQQPDAVL